MNEVRSDGDWTSPREIGKTQRCQIKKKRQKRKCMQVLGMIQHGMF